MPPSPPRAHLWQLTSMPPHPSMRILVASQSNPARALRTALLLCPHTLDCPITCTTLLHTLQSWHAPHNHESVALILNTAEIISPFQPPHRPLRCNVLVATLACLLRSPWPWPWSSSSPSPFMWLLHCSLSLLHRCCFYAAFSFALANYNTKPFHLPYPTASAHCLAAGCCRSAAAAASLPLRC